MIVAGPRVPFGFVVCQRIARSLAVFAFLAVSICVAAVGSSDVMASDASSAVSRSVEATGELRGFEHSSSPEAQFCVASPCQEPGPDVCRTHCPHQGIVPTATGSIARPLSANLEISSERASLLPLSAKERIEHPPK
jgi:hypothetical protein